MIKQTQKFFVRLLEQELLTVLAVLIVSSFVLWAKASDTASTTLSLTVYPAGGSVTVLAPNGGENWQVGSSQNITWETLGPVTDVTIELQRTSSGAWEEIVASTTNDGSYAWTVTEPATNEALIKITKVGDLAVTDTSDGVFNIVQASRGRAGYALPNPAIDNVMPSTIVNRVPVTLDISGINFRPGIYFMLDGTVLLQNSTYIDGTTAQATVPAGLMARQWSLWAINADGTRTIWGAPITIVATPYDAILQQDLPEVIRFYLHPSETARIVLPFTNYSNYLWDSRLKLGTVDPNDHDSVLYHAPTWPAKNRVVQYSGESVGYGGTIELPITIQAPLEEGTYRDSFKLVLDGVAWFAMQPIIIEVLVSSELKPPTTDGEELFYDAQLVAKSPNPRIVAGDEAELWVEYKNTGTLPWKSHGLNPVRLGTTHVRDRISRFAHPTWIINHNRVTVEDKMVVEPGEIGKFVFKIKAPTRTGYYPEWFGLVAEFDQWFKPNTDVRWDISVIRPRIVQPVVPSTGGESPPPPPPIIKAVRVFTDVTEQSLQVITRRIGSVLDKIGSLLRNLL